MEKINTEILIGSLFCIGFDKVDPLLFIYTLNKISIDNRKTQVFEFEDSEMNEIFKKYVDYNGVVFKLKEGITIDTMVSLNNEKEYPLRYMLNTNRKLIKYLSKIDYREIVLKKVMEYGIKDYSDMNFDLFSQMEIDLFKSMQGDSENKYDIRIPSAKEIKERILAFQAGNASSELSFTEGINIDQVPRLKEYRLNWTPYRNNNSNRTHNKK